MSSMKNSKPKLFSLPKLPKLLLVLASLLVLPIVANCVTTPIDQSRRTENSPAIASDGKSGGVVELETLIKISHPVELLAWNPDGKHVAVTGSTPEISVWDIEKRQLAISLRKPRAGSHTAIAYSPDGRYLAAGASVISLWDARTGTHLRDIVGPHIDLMRPQSIGIQSISFSPDGNTVAVTYGMIRLGRGYGFAICLFESESGKLIRSIESEGLTNTGIFFSKDGRQLFGTRHYSTGERDQRGAPVTYLVTNTELNVWDASSGQKTNTIKNIHVLTPWAFATNPDSKIFATGTWTGEIVSTRNRKTGEFHTIKNEDPIRLWNTQTGKLRSELSVSSHVQSLDFSPDGNFLVSSQWASPDAHDPIWLWRVSDGKLIQKAKFPKNQHNDTPVCYFSPDGSRLAAVIAFDLAIYRVRALP